MCALLFLAKTACKCYTCPASEYVWDLPFEAVNRGMRVKILREAVTVMSVLL